MAEPEEEEKEEAIHLPTTSELQAALRVASFAQDVCNEFIEKGRPDAYTFMNLCTALRELEDSVPGFELGDPAGLFFDRAEDLERFVKNEQVKAGEGE